MVIDHGKVSYAQIETEKGVVKVSDDRISLCGRMMRLMEFCLSRNRAPMLYLRRCK